MGVRVGINGFGSIGRRFFRQALGREGIEVVGINDLASLPAMAHLLKYDSNYGTLEADVTTSGNSLIIDGREFPFFSEREPSRIPWKDVGADVIIESTGVFREGPQAAAHIQAGAKKVVISAPGKKVDFTVVLGVNENLYDPAAHHVISNASCTTNCLAPVARVLHARFGIVRGLMTTVHAYTADQRILDLPHKDLRRARAAAANIVPTTTGAARAVGEVLPQLRGKLNGFALRVPVPTVSAVDLVVELAKPATVEEINAALEAAASGELRGILGFSREELVSTDFKGDPRSAIVDGPLTMVLEDSMAKVVAWYDNEWGYAARLVDLALFLAEKGL